jgi:hypothetical protein
VHPSRLSPKLTHIAALICSVEEVVAAYKALVAVYPSFTIEALQKILDARGQYNGFEKKHVKDVINQCRTVRGSTCTPRQSTETRLISR